VFDLSLPLRSQLDQARHQLQLETRRRRCNNGLVLKRVCLLKNHWVMLLQILDARAVNEEKQARDMFGDVLMQQAVAMIHGGYLDLLRIPP